MRGGEEGEGEGQDRSAYLTADVRHAGGAACAAGESSASRERMKADLRSMVVGGWVSQGALYPALALVCVMKVSCASS